MPIADTSVRLIALTDAPAIAEHLVGLTWPSGGVL
jgi:hypothetical protein